MYASMLVLALYLEATLPQKLKYSCSCPPGYELPPAGLAHVGDAARVASILTPAASALSRQVSKLLQVIFPGDGSLRGHLKPLLAILLRVLASVNLESVNSFTPSDRNDTGGVGIIGPLEKQQDIISCATIRLIA